MRGNKDYLESGWVASDGEAEKVIASYQEQYEAATGGDGASGNGAAPPKKAGDASGVKAKDLKGSLRFTVCTSFGMGLKVRYPASVCTLFRQAECREYVWLDRCTEAAARLLEVVRSQSRMVLGSLVALGAFKVETTMADLSPRRCLCAA